jgi:hypothetical protein
MWKMLYEACGGILAFSQATAEAIFKEVRPLAEPKWVRRMTDQEAEEWGPSTARQFRTMCKHIINAKKYQWVMKMLGLVPTEGEEAREEDKGRRC